MLAWLESFVGTFGYPLVGLLIMLESMGLPVPGETALLVAAAYAAWGVLNLRDVIAVAVAGAIVGDGIGYWLGRTQGLPLLERHGRLIHLDRRRLARAQALFMKHGPKTVFIGRFLPFLRMFAAFLAGVALMPWPIFTAYNALGGICWATTMGLLGYAFAENLPRLERWIGWTATVVVLVIVALGAGVVVGRLRTERANAEHAADVGPDDGP